MPGTARLSGKMPAPGRPDESEVRKDAAQRVPDPPPHTAVFAAGCTGRPGSVETGGQGRVDHRSHTGHLPFRLSDTVAHEKCRRHTSSPALPARCHRYIATVASDISLALQEKGNHR